MEKNQNDKRRYSVSLKGKELSKGQALMKKWDCTMSEVVSRLLRSQSRRKYVVWDATEPESEPMREAVGALAKIEKSVLTARYALERTQPLDVDELKDWQQTRTEVADAARDVRFRLDQLLNAARAGSCPIQMRELERLREKALAGNLTEGEIENLFRFWSGQRYKQFTTEGKNEQ